jgi:hypothetical protein
MPKKTSQRATVRGKTARKPPGRRGASNRATSVGRRTGGATARSEPVGSGTPTGPVRIARVAKGKKPQYFSDPAIDKLLWMTVTLMEELAVTRDRLDTVERLLDARKLVRVREIEGYVPGPQAEQERDTRRMAYVDRVMRAMQAELEEVTRKGMPKSEEEVVAIVAS